MQVGCFSNLISNEEKEPDRDFFNQKWVHIGTAVVNVWLRHIKTKTRLYLIPKPLGSSSCMRRINAVSTVQSNKRNTYNSTIRRLFASQVASIIGPWMIVIQSKVRLIPSYLVQVEKNRIYFFLSWLADRSDNWGGGMHHRSSRHGKDGILGTIFDSGR